MEVKPEELPVLPAPTSVCPATGVCSRAGLRLFEIVGVVGSGTGFASNPQGTTSSCI